MKILFLGDFMYDYDHWNNDIEMICDFIQMNDYNTVVNLETALGEKGNPILKGGPNIRSKEIAIRILKRMNVLAVTMANNHSMDFGEEALKDALEKLNENGVKCLGAGKNLSEAQKPLVLVKDNKKIIFLNCGWDVEETVYATPEKAGCNPLNRNRIRLQIRKLREEYPDSLIIPIFHWGFEFNTYPMPFDIAFAHECIDMGCNVIIGHHPHVIQAKERYKNIPVYYSLGNFYSGSHRSHFPVNFKQEYSESMCDYGLGVVYDTETGYCEELYFRYEREKDTTILLKTEDEIIKDISGISWKDDEYISLVKKHANNSNPILGLDTAKNNSLLRKLLFKHKAAIKLRFLKKSTIGRMLYQILKKIAG